MSRSIDWRPRAFFRAVSEAVGRKWGKHGPENVLFENEADIFLWQMTDMKQDKLTHRGNITYRLARFLARCIYSDPVLGDLEERGYRLRDVLSVRPSSSGALSNEAIFLA
jgi:hypothetical protein